jgi:hypothetical protein
MERKTRNWLIRFGATFALLLALCGAAPRWWENFPQFPPRTTEEMKTDVLERYFKLPQQDIVVVGSSLSYHLKEWYFTRGDVRNASIPGGSPLTGLAIIAAAPSARPRAIVVETNVLNRGIDGKLLAQYRTAQRHQGMLPPLRTLAAFYQGARDDTLTYSAERIRSIIAVQPRPDRSSAAVTIASDEWNRPLQRDTLVRDAETMKRLAAELEARGVKVFFFDVPYPSQLDRSAVATQTREVLAEIIRPDDRRWLTLSYPAGEMRSEADGVHLDDRSSVVFAAALDKAIHDRLARD